jgi:hypothetical protein
MLRSAEGDVAVSALAHHYNTHVKNSNFFKNLKERFTTAQMTDRLLRKTVAKNTWVYAAVSEIFLGRASMSLTGIVKDVKCKALGNSVEEGCLHAIQCR